MKKGQIALIVLVVSAIVMTVGLSISRKSVVETKITTDEESLKQAFNAAESGIDYYLGTGSTAYTASDNQSTAKVAVTSLGGGTNIVNLGGITLRNNYNYTWLVAHKDDGSLDLTNTFGATAMSICYDSAFDGSLLITYFYKNGANYDVYREGYNIKTSRRVSGFSDSSIGTSCGTITGMTKINLSVPLGGGNVPLLLVVKPIAGDTKIVVSATGGIFPDQETEISSTGRAGNVSSSTSSVNREVNVISQYQPPAFMMEAVTSAGSVLSN